MTSDAWWKRAVIYQVYPRSFQDSNGDGVGDLNGIAQRLEHLAQLGVDAVWISPIFPSPMRDFGYDVSDYCAIDPLFGTLADFDALLEPAHARGLKVILDFVPNHTSDQHPWFRESRSSKRNPKRDWYVWRDPKPDGSPPNNWESEFGGPAWTFDEATGQYYYHAYLKEQPDLNWRNPDVEAAMCDVLRFWFDRGVDGFRVDAIHHLHEDEEGRDNPLESRLAARNGAQRAPAADPDDRSAGRARFDPGDAAGRRRLSGSGDDRGGLPPDRPTDGLLRRGSDRLPPAVQLPPDLDRLEAQGARVPDRGVRGRAAGRGHGRTGCSATTTGRASRAGSDARRRGSRRCCS